jgi:hypothetical protein
VDEQGEELVERHAVLFGGSYGASAERAARRYSGGERQRRH